MCTVVSAAFPADCSKDFTDFQLNITFLVGRLRPAPYPLRRVLCVYSSHCSQTDVVVCSSVVNVRSWITRFVHRCTVSPRCQYHTVQHVKLTCTTPTPNTTTDTYLSVHINISRWILNFQNRQYFAAEFCLALQILWNFYEILWNSFKLQDYRNGKISTTFARHRPQYKTFAYNITSQKLGTVWIYLNIIYSTRMLLLSVLTNLTLCLFFLIFIYVYYAALLPRRGRHIASHSVCLSVCPSVCPSVPLLFLFILQ